MLSVTSCYSLNRKLESHDIVCSLVTGAVINMSELYLGIIFCFIFLNAIELPLAFRFGADKASVIRILISVVIFLIVSIYLLFGKRFNEVPIRCRIFNRPEAEEHFYPAYLAGCVRKGAVPVDGCSA